MSDEKITVEWIATASKMNQVLESLNTKLEKQEKQLQKIGDTSKKSADGAANSFNRLEAELKDNEAALKKLATGTAAFDEQRKKVDQLRKSFQGAKDELGKMGGETGGLLSTAVGKVAALAAGMASFQTIVSAVVAELEKTRTLRLEAAATTRTFEQALADVGQNIGAEAIPTARQMILENAPKLGTTNEGLADLLGVAISAGAKDLEEALSLVSASLKLTVGDAGRARALVGGSLNVASLAGSTNFEGALGQLLQVQSQVRATDLGMFSRNIAPGLAAATAEGQNVKALSTEQAFETAAVFSQILKDETGSTTSTAMRQFVAKMDTFVPELKKELKDGTVTQLTKEQINQFSRAGTIGERTELMRSSEPLRRQFLEGIEEGEAKVPIRELVQGTARALEVERKAQQAVTGIDAAQPQFQNLVDVLGGETAQLQAERVSQANIASSAVMGERDLAGTVQKIVDDTIAKVDLSGLDAETSGTLRNRMRLGSLAGEDPQQTGIAVLEQAKERRRAFGIIPAGGQMSAEDKALIDSQIEALRNLESALNRIAPAVGRQQPAQAMRPKEAPLPAATAP